MRGKSVWISFVCGLVVAFVAMSWLSVKTARMEKAEYLTAQQKENERLALWRMDSALVPLVAQESSRSHLAYSAFYRTEAALAKSMDKLGKREIRVPSSLLNFRSPFIRLHFQIDGLNQLSSPQVPSDEYVLFALDNSIVSRKQIEANRKLLQSLQNHLDVKKLRHLMRDSEASLIDESSVVVTERQLETTQQTDIPQQQRGARQQVIEQQFNRSRTEFQRRAQTNRNNLPPPGQFRPPIFNSKTNKVVQEPVRCLWLNDSLVMVRSTTMNGRILIQGCVLNWQEIESWLKEEVSDLLPEAGFEPMSDPTTQDEPLMLASLPVKVLPGNAATDDLPFWTPMTMTLTLAWAGMVVAAGAVGFMLFSVLRLSERRGAFVSAVTHELRTPLTTFRMYTEMLSEGMVRDDAKRKEYLETLRGEADRLGHLVENVLSYARLDSKRKKLEQQPVNLNDLVLRLEEPLRRLCSQSKMQLHVQLEKGEAEPIVVADEAAVERILVNLVDNACKYASAADDKRIVLKTEVASSRTMLTVQDFGPGIPSSNKESLFQPFTKSDREAANSAPGIGLGLSLCGKLAESMGGKLKLNDRVEQGACFVLVLPTA